MAKFIRQKSFSAKETQAFGEQIARTLTQQTRKTALVLALRGDLGAGKTTFVQGFFHGLGVRKKAQSPTFIIIRRHRIPRGRFSDIFHVDAYRLKQAGQLKALGVKNFFANRKNIFLIEWAERVKTMLPKDVIWLTFCHGTKENERVILTTV
jgi:tRNA threonylcarbamoyladenosine biosynthesis protein TsaE